MTLTLTGNITKNNGNDDEGIDIFASAVDTVNITGTRNVVRNNTDDGIQFNISGAVKTVNFGDGTAGTGLNSFTDKGNAAAEFDMNNVSAAAVTINAIGNFWVDPTPDDGDEFENGTGTINVTPALAADPNAGL